MMHFMFFFHYSAISLTVHPPVTFSSGDTITIQIVANMRLHVGCFSGNCGEDYYVGSYFDPLDYHKCVGQVFQIYVVQQEQDKLRLVMVVSTIQNIAE